ncbi:unnamed protein product [Blepharisma stoltei]|uniref:NADH dehydrogenase [ubiquinone] 1 alpha subcomplex subunit 12 n=1 Tax=Blepharisma stoltei TaxID=1481888 RepID=A0AAU9KN50_9CILI|nr:unnamed protein product [Blepharisma stoltei]
MIIRRFGFLKNLRNFLRNTDGRKLVGTDMYENKYYQILDEDGRPFKREVEYKEGIRNPTMDPIWAGWLCGRDRNPPKPEDVKSSQDSYLYRKKIGEEADKVDEEKMKEFRDVMQKTANSKPNEPFKPEEWKPQKKDKKY